MQEDVIALLIPIVAVFAVFGLGAFKVWIAHRERLQMLRLQQAEKQAELDRQLLGLGDPTQQAHLTVILDRLSSIERRLEGLEARPRTGPEQTESVAPVTALPVAPLPAAAEPAPDFEAPDRRRQTDTDHNI